MVVLFVWAADNKEGVVVEGNTPTTSQTKTRWKIIAIAFIVLSVLLVGSTAYFAIRNANNTGEKSSIEPPADTPKKECEVESDITANYLVVEEWGIRFKKPVGFTELSYAINDNRLDFAGIFDSNHGVDVFRFNSAADEFAWIIRYPENNDPNTGHTTAPPPIASKDGYNYRFVKPQQSSWESVFRENQAIIASFLLQYMAEHIEFI